MVKEVAVAADECIVTRRFVVLVAFLALVCAAPAAAFADGTILVKFASGSGAGAKVAALGDDVTGKTVGDVQVVDPQPGESLSEALAHYRARPDVLYAERNTVLHQRHRTSPALLSELGLSGIGRRMRGRRVDRRMNRPVGSSTAAATSLNTDGSSAT